MNKRVKDKRNEKQRIFLFLIPVFTNEAYLRKVYLQLNDN